MDGNRIGGIRSYPFLGDSKPQSRIKLREDCLPDMAKISSMLTMAVRD